MGHLSSSCRSASKKNPEKRPFSATGGSGRSGAGGSGAASSAAIPRTPLTAPSWGTT